MKKYYSFMPHLFLRYKKSPDLNLSPQSIIYSYATVYSLEVSKTTTRNGSKNTKNFL